MWSLISSLWDRLELSSFAQYQKDHLKYTARNNLLKWFDSNKMSSLSTPRISPVRWERAPRNAVTVFFRYVRTTWRFDSIPNFFILLDHSEWPDHTYFTYKLFKYAKTTSILNQFNVYYLRKNVQGLLIDRNRKCHNIPWYSLLVTPKFCIRETENNAYTKFWSDQQRVSWYVMAFSVAVN